ncbi:MAG: ABC transporter ATP-binding protein [Bacteroidales bacterium]|nr:ABC transporter ATP-binding protein [Bacteroidales bacterium]
MQKASIIVKDVTKKYGNSTALNGLSLEVEHAEIFGLIGPDGAGKTSLFRILTSLLVPDSGMASLEGFDVVKDYREIRKIVGYMPGRFSLYFDLTVQENLEFFATIFGTSIQQNYDLIKDIYSQIEPFKNRKAGKLSGGMKQKLALSCAMIHKPQVLILDEPTTGVDAVSRKEFWEMLKALKKEGITILVSTPYMDEAILCDRVALIQKGRILSIEEPQKIIVQYAHDLYSICTDNMFDLLEDLRNFSKSNSAFRFGDTIHLSVKSGFEKAELVHYLEGKNHEQIEIGKIDPEIEDCFMELMTDENKI